MAQEKAPIVKNVGYTRIENLKEELRSFFDGGGIPKRVVIMIGAADYFDKGKRENPYELIALVKYLKSIQAHDPTDEEENDVTQVLAFDSAYTDESILNDQYHLNWSIYEERLKKRLTKETFIDDIEYNPNEYISGNQIGNIVFHHMSFNLSTRYAEVSNPSTYYPYLNGKTPVKTMADQCVPKEGSVMKAIQDLCVEIPFQEYYLYNCAWIGGTQAIETKNGITRLTRAKRNRHYESMCELLYIFLRLGKPAYLLTARPMSVFEHTGKKVGEDSLNSTPLNDTTVFYKEEWAPLKVGGGTRKLRKTKKRKHSRKH